MKKYRNLKQKIIFYVMSVSITAALIIILVMSFGSIRSTNTVLLDNTQITARIAAQNVSSNLHLLTERMYNFSKESIFLDSRISAKDKQARFEEIKQQIEFVWLSAYDTKGQKLYGDDTAPDSIADMEYFSKMTQSGNLVIGEPYYKNQILQLCVGVPLADKNGVTAYLVGSYKYDILNDVLSQLVLGSSGSAYIINDTGMIIGDRQMSNVGKNKNLSDLYPVFAEPEYINKITAFQTGSTVIKLGSQKQYIGYSPIAGTNWTLLIHAPRHEFMGTTYWSIGLSIVLSLILLLTAAAIMVPISHKISHPLSEAARRLKALSDGDLTQEVLLSDTKDETSILTEALSRTIISLKAYIEDIETCLSTLAKGDYTIRIPDHFHGDFSSIRNSLANITNALNHTMLRMNQSSKEVSDCAKQLLDGSKEQSILLADMKDNMSAITSSIEHNKENVLQIENFAKMATEKTSLGSNYMQSMLDAMSQIHTTVNEISKVSLMIEDIARQTNLLSLNASVEAARAGTAGDGFAVVASEINQLSTQTADALQETSALISRSSETIQAGLTTANQTANTFQEIANLTQQYWDISSRLSDTVSQQTDAVEHANNHLLMLQEIAGKNDQMAAESLSQAELLRDYVLQVRIKEF